MKHHKNPNRHRKHVPYGSKGYCGIGGEIYSRKHGYIVDDIVDKRSYRQEIRKLLKQIKDSEQTVNWIFQKDKDIETEIDWGYTVFELIMDDSEIIRAGGILDETYEGEVCSHLDNIKTGEPVNYDKIIKWRIIGESNK